MNIINSILPILALLVMGYIMRWRWIKNAQFWKTVNSLIYYALFPALLIKSIAFADFSDISFTFIPILIMIIIGFVAIMWMCKPLFSNTDFWVVFVQGAIRYNNYIFIGVTYLYVGQHVTAIIALIIAFLIMSTNIMSVYFLNLYGTVRLSIWQNILSTLTNPIIFSCLLGLVLNAGKTIFPIIVEITWINTTLSHLGNASLVLSLLAIGATLEIRNLGIYYKSVIMCAIIKLVLLPITVVGVLSYLQFDPVIILVCMIYAGSPCSANATPMTQAMQGDYKNMSLIISVQTVSCLLTLPMLLYAYEMVF